MNLVRKDVRCVIDGYIMKEFGALVVIIVLEQDLDAKNTNQNFQEYDLSCSLF